MCVHETAGAQATGPRRARLLGEVVPQEEDDLRPVFLTHARIHGVLPVLVRAGVDGQAKLGTLAELPDERHVLADDIEARAAVVGFGEDEFGEPDLRGVLRAFPSLKTSSMSRFVSPSLSPRATPSQVAAKTAWDTWLWTSFIT